MGFNATQFFEFNRAKYGGQPNVFIGGVASVINTPQLLADKLRNYPSGTAFSASNIKSFSIVGNDIQCYIGVDYIIFDATFSTSVIGNVLTYYYDYGNKCKELRRGCFSTQTNFIDFKLDGVLVIYSDVFISNTMSKFIFPNVIDLHNGGTNNIFFGLPNAEIVYLPNCLYFGWQHSPNIPQPNVNNGCFNNIKLGCKIYVHPSMETINSGLLEADLAYARDTRGAIIRYVTNFTAPSKITNLSVKTVYLTLIELQWSEPSNLNGIDFYEIYVDGVKNKEVKTLSTVVFGLTNLQTYTFTVIAVDNFYNKSEVSNSVAQQINGVGYSWQENIISYYKFNDNVLDSVGGNNGTATATTYENGLVGKRAIFNGTTSKIEIADNNNLSFTNGVNDLPFSISMIVNFSATGDRWLINKRDGTSAGLQEWQLIYFQGKLAVYLFNHNTTGFIFKEYLFTPTLGVNYHVNITYNGSGLHTGLNIYINGVSVGVSSLSGVYSRMINSTSKVTIGKAGFGSFFFNGKIDETAIFNKELSQSEVTEIYNLGNNGFELI